MVGKVIRRGRAKEEEKYNHATMVYKNLWVGNYVSALDRDFLRKNRVCLIVSILDEPQTVREISGVARDMNITHVFDTGIQDDLGFSKNNQERLYLFYQKHKDMIQNHLLLGGVLIHCRAGMQRSAAVAAMVIMDREKVGFEEAKKIVKKRSVAFMPLVNFGYVLKKYFPK